MSTIVRFMIETAICIVILAVLGSMASSPQASAFYHRGISALLLLAIGAIVARLILDAIARRSR